MIPITLDLDAGLLWIETRIRELAKEPGWTVYCMEWSRQIDAQTKRISLKLWCGEEFRTIEFRREEMLGVEGDPEVQQRLGERIG